MIEAEIHEGRDAINRQAQYRYGSFWPIMTQQEKQLTNPFETHRLKNGGRKPGQEIEESLCIYRFDRAIEWQQQTNQAKEKKKKSKRRRKKRRTVDGESEGGITKIKGSCIHDS